tara:strand:- start:611 stop:781 length:171 start_codon:yes stop_codon:yes gene_type:complete
LSIAKAKPSAGEDINCYIKSLLLSVTMTLIGRTSMMAFVLMTTNYLVTGQIIPGVL